MKKLLVALIYIISACAACGGAYMTGITEKTASAGNDFFDVVYKKAGNAELILDFYPPTANFSKKTPVVVYFHGGAWISGDRKSDIKPLNMLFRALREKGYAVASADYRLIGAADAKFPSCIEDCTDAVRFLVRNAEKFGLDTQRVAVMGSSAGGHLALLAGLSGGSYVTEDKTQYSVKCIVDLFGPAAFVTLDSIGIERTLAKDLFFGFNASDEMYIMASPLFYLNRHSPPIFIVHGINDSIVNIKHSELLYERAKKVGVDAAFVAVKNAEHGLSKADPQKPQEPTIKEVMERTTEFLDEHMQLETAKRADKKR